MFLRKNSPIALLALSGSASAIKMESAKSYHAVTENPAPDVNLLERQNSDPVDPAIKKKWQAAAADVDVLQELTNMSAKATNNDIAPCHWFANRESMEADAGSMPSPPKRRRASFASVAKGAMTIKSRMMSTKETTVETPKELLARARVLAKEINECVDLVEAQQLKVELDNIHTAFETAQKSSGRNRSLGSNAMGNLVAKAVENIAEKQAIADEEAAQRESDLNEAKGLLQQANLSVQACFDVEKGSTQVAMQAMDLRAIVKKYENDDEFLTIKDEMTRLLAKAVEQKASSGNRKRHSKTA